MKRKLEVCEEDVLRDNGKRRLLLRSTNCIQDSMYTGLLSTESSDMKSITFPYGTEVIDGVIKFKDREIPVYLLSKNAEKIEIGCYEEEVEEEEAKLKILSLSNVRTIKGLITRRINVLLNLLSRHSLLKVSDDIIRKLKSVLLPKWISMFNDGVGYCFKGDGCPKKLQVVEYTKTRTWRIESKVSDELLVEFLHSLRMDGCLSRVTFWNLFLYMVDPSRGNIGICHKRCELEGVKPREEDLCSIESAKKTQGDIGVKVYEVLNQPIVDSVTRDNMVPLDKVSSILLPNFTGISTDFGFLVNKDLERKLPFHIMEHPTTLDMTDVDESSFSSRLYLEKEQWGPKDTARSSMLFRYHSMTEKMLRNLSEFLLEEDLFVCMVKFHQKSWLSMVENKLVIKCKNCGGDIEVKDLNSWSIEMKYPRVSVVKALRKLRDSGNFAKVSTMKLFSLLLDPSYGNIKVIHRSEKEKYPSYDDVNEIADRLMKEGESWRIDCLKI